MKIHCERCDQDWNTNDGWTFCPHCGQVPEHEVKMKQIKAYQAEDGTVFADPRECSLHEVRQKFRAYYKDHQLYGMEDYHVDADTLFLWIFEHSDMVLEIVLPPAMEAKNGNPS